MANTVEPVEAVQQPMSDDQELAKVLAGINQQADDAADAGVGMVVPPAVDDTNTAPAQAPEPAPEQAVEAEAPAPPVTEMPVVEEPAPIAAPSSASGDLTSVKSEAINELRPLVDKLNLPPEEKFDTYLLLLRSTDDRSLIEPAHEVARQITDETRRAQALLDIIKEIDFLSQAQQN
jgi:hypothetical protein